MTEQQWIFLVVDSFYQVAKSDVLIGYHFRNIADFDEHIPRIATFWELQLLGSSSRPLERPFDVMNLHLQLGIKRGELGRWLLLFRQALQAASQQHPQFSTLQERWLERLVFFEGVFLRFLGF
jgi:truncated hemoglobin YjbI